MSEEFDAKVAPAKAALREALSALSRAQRDDCLPHTAACLKSALDHATRARTLVEKIKP